MITTGLHKGLTPHVAAKGLTLTPPAFFDLLYGSFSTSSPCTITTDICGACNVYIGTEIRIAQWVGVVPRFIRGKRPTPSGHCGPVGTMELSQMQLTAVENERSAFSLLSCEPVTGNMARLGHVLLILRRLLLWLDTCVFSRAAAYSY